VKVLPRDRGHLSGSEMHKRAVPLTPTNFDVEAAASHDGEAEKGHTKGKLSWRSRRLYSYLAVFVFALFLGIFIAPLATLEFKSVREAYIKWRWTRPANEFKTIRQGFELSPTEPFIVRGAKDFDHIPLSLAREEINKHAEDWLVFGNVIEDGSSVSNIPLASLLRDFENDNLTVTVFEAPVNMFPLPSSLKDHHELADFERDDPNYVLLAQTPVLSKAEYLSPWHIDPLGLGGGWMYLWQGRKEWKFHSPWVAPLYYTTDPVWDSHIKDHSVLDFFKAMQDKPALASRVSAVRTATVAAGDFVYFPPSWLHRVQTREKALGLGGYIRPPETVPVVAEVEELFNSLSLNGTWNSRELILPPSPPPTDDASYANSSEGAEEEGGEGGEEEGEEGGEGGEGGEEESSEEEAETEAEAEEEGASTSYGQ